MKRSIVTVALTAAILSAAATAETSPPANPAIAAAVADAHRPAQDTEQDAIRRPAVAELEAWRPKVDARDLATLLMGFQALGPLSGKLEAQANSVGHIEALTETGEAIIRGWQPRAHS